MRAVQEAIGITQMECLRAVQEVLGITQMERMPAAFFKSHRTFFSMVTRMSDNTLFNDASLEIGNFIDEARETGLTYRWAIRPDPTRPDFILFYPHVSGSIRCPYLPIHRDRIHRLRIVATAQCSPQGPGLPTQAWVAEVTLKQFHFEKEPELAGAFSLLALESDSNCGCDYSSEPSSVTSSSSAIVGDLEIGDTPDMVPANTVLVYVEANCPRCSCRLASYRRYVESSRAYIGAIVTITFNGACFNRGYCGSGRFDWRGSISSGRVYRLG